MSVLEQEYEVAAPIEQVWQALTDPEQMSIWTGEVAQSTPAVGGNFSLWGGDIHGTYTRLNPYELIEQDWYGHDNPSWKYRVQFSLSTAEHGTKVHMTYSGDIVDEKKDITDWRDYYFDPIKKLLEKQ